MDNKRKGSSPPRSPSGDGRFEWDEPPPRDTFNFADDDDDGPLPAPPEFDGQNGGVPDLLDGEEAIIEEAEPIDDPELLDSALVTPVRTTHAMPPPIPAPVPTGPSRRGFIDDGEIALPPRLSRHVQSFPFRKVRAEDDPSAEETLDDDPSPDTAGWRSAALDDDDDEPEEMEPEELDDADAEMVDDEPPPPPPPARGDALHFSDDDDAPPPAPPMHADTPAYAEPTANVTGSRWSFADLPASASAAAHPVAASSGSFAGRSGARPGLWDDDDEPATMTSFRGDLAREPAAPPAAPPAEEPDRDPARMFADPYRDDDDRAAQTVADGPVADETGLYGDPRGNAPTGMYDRSELTPPARPAGSPLLALPDDDELQLPVDDDAPPPTPAPTQFVDDDDERTATFSADRLREVATASSSDLSLRTDDDETSGWVHARMPQPSAAIQVALDDDDDAAWEPPARSIAAPIVTPTPTPPVAPVASASSPTTVPIIPMITRPPASSPPIERPPIAAPVPIITRVVTEEDAEASGIGGWIATRPGASIASGAIPVAEFADDDDWPTVDAARGPAARAGNPPGRPAADELAPIRDPAELSALTAVETALKAAVQAAPRPTPPPFADDDDDEQTREAAVDDDDEWEPHGPVTNLAPIPDDLGEPFPLDLWSDPDELIDREIDGYRLDQPLSRGMATRVYLGESLASGRRVAVRVLGPMHSPAEPRARQFLYEAQQLMKLRNEHVVEVLAAGTTSDHLTYYVMEYVEGETLASTLRADGPMQWADVAAFANQICDALILAADRGIVHNDLNATTCMRVPAEPVRAEGEPPRDVIKLLDLGVAPLVSVYRNIEGTWTQSQGTPPGAAEFMAPEIAGGGRPDARTAVYAVGVLMYELATGRPPFRGDSFISVLKKQMYEEPTSPRLVVPEQEIAEVFEQVVLRALAKAPGDRYSDLRALDEALLAARAREGELRRVTQILALDPAFWDEDGSRRIKQASQAHRAADPTPLATFAADLKANQPELAAAVFNKHDPARRPGREPSVALHLSQLAAPIVAPALPPIQANKPVPGQVILMQRPGTTPGGNSLVRVVSLSIVGASVLLLLVMWISDRNRPAARKPPEVAADSNKRPAAKTKPRPSREPRPRAEPPVTPPPTVVPTTVLAPQPEEPEVKQLPPAPEPEPEPIKQPPPPAPEPEPVVPEPEPEPEPTPAVVPEPVKPPPVKTPQPAKKPPPGLRDPNDDRPESITAGRLQAKLKSMEERVSTRCRSKAGVPDPRGIAVTVRVVVDVKGEVKATAMANWANTPMGQCIEEVLEAIRFNETRTGGGRTHTFKF